MSNIETKGDKSSMVTPEELASLSAHKDSYRGSGHITIAYSDELQAEMLATRRKRLSDIDEQRSEQLSHWFWWSLGLSWCIAMSFLPLVGLSFLLTRPFVAMLLGLVALNFGMRFAWISLLTYTFKESSDYRSAEALKTTLAIAIALAIAVPSIWYTVYVFQTGNIF
jgi:hypothetical protein